MWILFLVVLINGQADSKWVPFNTQKACETAKADATKHLAAIFPSGEASLTCFKANDVGKLT